MKLQHWAGVVVASVAFAAYFLTLSPTVNFIDSGELITVGVTAGIAHPPGYPFYTLLSILAASVPLGAAAVRINLLSALFGALGVGFFYALVYEALAHHVGGRETGDGRRETVVSRQGPGLRRQPPAVSDRRPPPKAQNIIPKTQNSLNVASERQPPSIIQNPKLKTQNSLSAAGAALLLAAAQTYWNWSTQDKFYTLHFAFVAVLFWLALRVRRARRATPAGAGGRWPPRDWPAPARWLVALAVTLGLTFTNHSTSLLQLPGLVVLLLWPVAGDGAGSVPVWRWALRYFPALLVAGAVPLLLYLYLPLRASQHPILDWGEPDNWRDFWRHITLWQYHGYIAPQGSLSDYIGLALGFAAEQLGPWLGAVALVLAGLGVTRLARVNWPLIMAPALTIIFVFFFTFSDQNAEIEAYSTPMYMMILLWTGIGLDWILHNLRGRLFRAGRASTQETPRSAIRDPRSAILAVPLLLGLLAFAWNAGRAGHRDDYTGEAYVRNHMAYLAPNAILITDNWYITSPTYYLQYVLNERRDVTVIDKNLARYPFYLDYMDRQYASALAPVKQEEAAYRTQEALWYDGRPYDQNGLPQLYFAYMRAIIGKNLAAGRPVYLEWYTNDSESQAISRGFATHPEGLTLRVDSQPFSSTLPTAQFDFRGILSDPTPKDRVAHWVVDYYPLALDRLAAYAQAANQPAQATQYRNQAAAVRAALGLHVR